MGDGLTEEKPKEPKEPTTMSRVFRDAFPHYLAIGMSAEEFWDGAGWLAKSYREAYRIRTENEARMTDRMMWRMGEYIRYALVSTPMTVNGWAPKGHHMQDYPAKPLMDQYEEDRKAETRKKKEENRQELAQAMFQAFAEKINKGIRKRLEAEKESGKAQGNAG